MSSLQTNLTVKQIEELIIRNKKYFDINKDIAIPNLSWSLLDYEADLIVLNKSGYVTEFEIKRSYADLCKDFKKKHFHDSEIISNFYYVLPKSIEQQVYELFDKHMQDEKYVYSFGLKHHPAVIFYDEEGNLTSNMEFSNLYGKRRKLFMEEKLTLLRLLNYRYWNLRMKSQEEKTLENEQHTNNIKNNKIN